MFRRLWLSSMWLALAGALSCHVTIGQTVSVWLTTDDQTKLLQPQASITFSTVAHSTNQVIVDETRLYQAVEGFGASFTDTTGYALNQVATPAARTNALLNLFTRNGGGIGLSFVRNPMGASDLARYHYSYDDNPPGGTDTNLAYFSIAHDQADIIPLLQQALQLNPQLKIMANPWSPPGWMKTSGSMIGGSLLPAMYGPFARYFVKYIQAYQGFGIPVHYISLQNEPLYVPSDYPGMSMDAATQTIVLRDYVLPALASNHLATRVLVYDHNWDRPDYPDTVFSDNTLLNSSQVAGTAWHGYGGTPGAMLTIANKYPGEGNYLTEHSGGTWVSDQVRSDFEEIIHCLRSSAKSYVKWNMVADSSDGPHAGGCGTCTPLVYVNTNSGAVSYSVDFYTLGHFSKFILPGASRIYSANGAGIVTAAFLNPDGSKAVVAFNDTVSSRTFQVQWGNRSFAYTLPSYAGATFTWTGTQNGACILNPTNGIQASSFDSVFSLQTEPTTDSLGGYDVGYASTGSYSVYRSVDLSTGFTNVIARVASAGSGGTIECRLDNPAGPLAGSIPVPVTGGWQTWRTVTGALTGGNGLHDLYLVFRGGSAVGNLNWFQFSDPVPTLSVTVWPTAQTAEEGSTARIQAQGESPAPGAVYQWLFGQAGPLIGATDALLQLNDVRPNQAGAYTVMVTNMGLCVTSGPAWLSVIPPVERRPVPALHLTSAPGSLLHLEYADSLPALQWLSLADVPLGNASEYTYALSQPLPAQRFYRSWQTNEPPPGVEASTATEIKLTGAIGSAVRVDYINAIGPTDAWVTLDTVTLTNTTQLYDDLNAYGQLARLYRLVSVP